MIPKPIDGIEKPDIQALVANAVGESRTIDYKLTLPGGGDEDKREFLADVSSFANAAGGDLVYGVEEKNSVPVAIPGLSGLDADKDILRLEEVVRTGIDPRVPGVRMRLIQGFQNGPVLVIRVDRSFAAPHMVTFKNLSRFFTRNSKGKYQMDVGELRAAFAVSESLGEKMRRFRADRLARIVTGETPVPVASAPKLILHLVPLSAFALASPLDRGLQHLAMNRFKPIAASGWSHRHNLDGFLTFLSVLQGTKGTESYCQFFRHGAIEAVWADVVYIDQGRKLICGNEIERHLMEAIENYAAGLNELGVPFPLLLMVALMGVQGAQLALDIRSIRQSNVVDRDTLLLPEVLIEQAEFSVLRDLRPLFDALWNAAGFERCLDFDEDGNWIER